MVFYTAFNSISVVSQWQLTLFMLSWVSPVLKAGLWSALPKDTPTKKPRGSSVAQTQDPWIMSQTLYHWAMWDPEISIKYSTINQFIKNIFCKNVLTLYQTRNFWIGPDWKHLQATK